MFNKYDLHALLEDNKRRLREAILSLKPDNVLKSSEEDLIAYLVDQWTFEIPEIHEEAIHVEYADKNIDVSHDPMRPFLDRSRPYYVPGTELTFVVPLSGDTNLLNIQPLGYTWTSAGQRAVLAENEIRFRFVGTELNPERAKIEFESELRLLKQNLASLANSLKQRNSEIEQQIRTQLNERKQKLLKDAQTVESIGFPIKRRDGVATTYAVPVQKKKPKITAPQPPSGSFQPEPLLDLNEYESILAIVRNMVHVMEQSPTAFESIDEEALRTHFLVQLNGQYEGKATGETFNFQGKTDILIRVDGKNVFIAECKFWRGEKQLLETIDQLLSYLCWRDTKAAVFVFNRNVNFSDVIAKISEVVPRHPHYKRTVSDSYEGCFRYVFGQPADRNREVVLSVIAFDVPKLKK